VHLFCILIVSVCAPLLYTDCFCMFTSNSFYLS